MGMLTPVLFLITFFLILWQMMRKPKKFPPGPIRWPLIGNIFEVKSTNLCRHEVIEKLAQKYGEMTGYYVARCPVVVISGVDAIREALNKPELQARPVSAVNRLEKKRLGIVLTDDEFWKEQRRFVLRHLKELGMGKGVMEKAIHEEIADMIAEVKRFVGSDWKKSIPVHEMVAASGANLIFNMLAGQRFKRSDPQLQDLMNTIKNLTTLLDSSGGLASSMPILLRVFPSLTEYPEALKCRKRIYSFLTEVINEHKNKLDPENPRDFIDMYLLEMQKPDVHPSFHMEQLLYLLTELFVAGSDSTSGVLSYAILFMVLYPAQQTKVQKELDEVVGRKRLPTFSDKAQLRYTEATLNEVYRHATVAPLALPHAVVGMEDVDFRGYTIPKEARVIINLHGMNNERKYWRDPGNFRPDRFLDDYGNLRREDALIQFGLGKRACIGESLARNNIFLTFAVLLQNYTLRIPDGDPTPSAFPDGGMIITTKPFKIRMTPRPL